MIVVDDFFQNKKHRNLFFVVLASMWFIMRIDADVYEDTLISSMTISIIHLVVSLFALIIIVSFPYVRNFLFKLTNPLHKVIFVIIPLLFCYYLGDFSTYIFLKINQPFNPQATELVQAPILTAEFTDFAYAPGMKKILVCTSVKGEKRTFWFSNNEDNQAIYETNNLTLTLAKGRLGYDYIMRKDIIKNNK